MTESVDVRSSFETTFFAFGSFTSTPFCSMGVTTMKMMRRTRTMSINGTTLICAPPLSPVPAISDLAVLLEIIEKLQHGVVHVDRERLDAVREVVEEPHGGDGHEQTERGGDERLGDTAGDRGHAARLVGRHRLEGVDDAEDGSEETDERR